MAVCHSESSVSLRGVSNKVYCTNRKMARTNAFVVYAGGESIPIHRFEPCGPPNEKFCCHLLRASGSGFIFLGCGKLVEVVMREFQLIHNCDAAKYKQGEIVEILPPHTKAPPSLVYSLHMAIHRKKYGWRVD